MNDLLSQVQIRHLIRVDLPALEWNGEYTHFRRLFKEAYRKARMGRAILWVAILGSQHMLGQVFVQLKGTRAELSDGLARAHLYSIRVRPAYRNAGLGSRLLCVAERDLTRRGFQWATLNVGCENSAAIRFYERHGYQIIASEPGLWSYLNHHGQLQTVHEPSWRMEKELLLEILSVQAKDVRQPEEADPCEHITVPNFH